MAYNDSRGFSTSAIFRAGSGQPYTPVIESGFGNGLETNSGRKPTGTSIDVRAEKATTFQGMSLGLFGRIFNLLDSRYNNGAVFGSTGSPYYSRFPEADEVALNDPTRFYSPRRIEFGIRLTPGIDRTEGGK
ncbi:MAG: TonB-dependent receptor [bacterium]|nr:MAG: TonB-dependent receptor [bacterium]